MSILKKPVVVAALIGVAGTIFVTVVTNIFASRADKDVKSTHINDDFSISQPVGQSGINTGVQYYSNGDMNINQVQTPSYKTKEIMEEPKKLAQDSTIPTIAIKDNEGFINIGGTNNTYNQSINPKPKARELSIEDVQRIMEINPPKNYSVEIDYSATEEAEAYAKQVEALFRVNGYQIHFNKVYLLIAPPAPRFNINIDHEKKMVNVTILKQEN